MIVIVEGVDGAGKTTFLDQLQALAEQRDLRVHRLKRGAPEPGGPTALEEYHFCLDEPRLLAQVLSEHDLVLCDRWHLGDLVYGGLYRGGSRLTPAQLLHTELLLTALGAVKLIITAELATVRRRLADRGEDYLRPGDVEHVWRWYRTAGATWPWAHDWTTLESPVDQEELSHVLAWAEVQGHAARRYARYSSSYVGQRAPTLLLVGDQPNGYPYEQLSDRAFLPVRANSGHWLLSGLLAQHPRALRANRLALCNSVDDDLPGLYGALAAPRVLGLGQRAQERLEATGVPFSARPHPQWVRRFTHAHLHEYAGELLTYPTGVRP